GRSEGAPQQPRAARAPASDAAVCRPLADAGGAPFGWSRFPPTAYNPIEGAGPATASANRQGTIAHARSHRLARPKLGDAHANAPTPTRIPCMPSLRAP